MKKIFILFLLLLMPIFSIGQVKLPEGIEEQISVDFSNKYPDPNETVSVSVVSYTTDLNKADITWLINDVIQMNETGATKFSFTVGDVGSITKLSLNITKRGGGTFSKEYVFNIAEVDLMYVAQTTVPPLYDGKALFSNQSAVKIFAEPRFIDSSGALISKDRLVYSWEVSDFNRQDLSGIGKDFIEYKGSLITRPLVVGVTVSAIDSKAYARKKIVLSPTNQNILIYENNPLLGVMYEQAINDDFILDREEVTLKAENIFFNKSDDIDIFWSLNGENVELFRNLENAVFRNENNEAGMARISVRSENPERILQGANGGFKLQFEGN